MPHPQADVLSRVRLHNYPLANPANVVICDEARFTVLTPRLVRLEWSAGAAFEDRGTYAFPSRYGPEVALVTTQSERELVLDTGALVVQYLRGSGPFTAENLTIRFVLDGAQRSWVPGMDNPDNLRGTRRTLDVCAGEVPLEPGLVSRAGWAVVDDSAAVLFDETGWVVPRPEHPHQDWYFFGYGHDYPTALGEYMQFGGRVPLIPRFVLGTWWSRYWAYTADELKTLVQSFAEHQLPLDVLVLDMDWHTPEGWTGYTWNRTLFPDPPAFLRWVHDHGLRMTLNLHPADGVQPFEERYASFAHALGLDPSTQQTIPFNITDEQYVKLYFELLHHPLEDEGVDFWWMDWQQGTTTSIKGLDPLPWLNHLHFLDSTRRGTRPLLYSRWGGLGNHRYPIGFSGDTYATWAALQFQPYFTATAANVGYGWWSHDIGGHIGATEPELYTRWVQYGALSPCLRLHAMKDPLAERRPWAYPAEVFRAAQAAFTLRYALVPYLYTMARVAMDTGIALCRPLYYAQPEADAAYLARHQYFLGDQILAAPILRPADPSTGLATTDVWLPDGTWIAYDTKETFVGPGWRRLMGNLQRIPMLVKAGGIIPLARPALTTDALPKDHLILTIFPGRSGEFRLYEDDGTTDGYTHGKYEWTTISMRQDGPNRCVVQIAATEGHCAALPEARAYTINVVGAARPVEILLDNLSQTRWSYDSAASTLTIDVPHTPKQQPVTIRIITSGPLWNVGQDRNTQLVEADIALLLPHTEQSLTVETALQRALEADPVVRANVIARIGGPWAHTLELVTPDEASVRLGWLIIEGPQDGSTYSARVLWRQVKGSAIQDLVGDIDQARDALHLPCPFKYTGGVQPLQWEAHVTLRWRGAEWSQDFRSALLFPAVPEWRVLVYNQAEQRLTTEQIFEAAGALNQDLPWQTVQYDPQTITVQNLRTPFGIRFVERYRPQLRAGQPLAAFVTTTVTSPDDRFASVVFPSLSPTTLYLNGQLVDDISEIETYGDDVFPSFFRPRRTAPLQLRAGKNTLLLATLPPGNGQWWAWSASAVLEHPGGTPMLDLSFSAEAPA